MPARSPLILGAAVALASVTAGSASAVTDRHPAVPASASRHGWTPVSSSPVQLIDSLSLARFGKQLQAVWAVGSGTPTDLRTRIVSLTGKPIGAQIDPLTGSWGTINEYPVIFNEAGHRVIGFSGIQDTNTSNPYSQGYQYVLDGGTAGTGWSLTADTLTNSSSADGSYGTDVTMVNGTPLTAYTLGSDRTISYRLGQPKPIPADPSADGHGFVDSICCTYNTGVGYDATRHQAWAVWYDNSGLRSTDGVDAQQLLPTIGGSPVHAPGSNQPDPSTSGKYTSTEILHRIQVAQRLGGGLYAAYAEGYPSANKVALWRVGAGKAMVRKVGPELGTDVQAIGAAAGIKGRVWMYWWVNGKKTIQVARSSPDVSHIGSTCSIKLPSGASTVVDMVGNATNGPLTLLIEGGSSTGTVYSKVIGGCFGVAVSPHKIKHSKGGKVHVFVTDAGAPVKAAKVHFRGKTHATNKRGRTTFTVAKGTAKGTYKLTVTRKGFRKATRYVRIT